jgi:predicted kinase
MSPPLVVFAGLPGVGKTTLARRVAEAVAADQLRAGRPVVTDAVNSLELAPDGWRAVATGTDTQVRSVQVICCAEARRHSPSRSTISCA